MFKFYSVCLLGSVFLSVQSEPGHCPDVKLMENFKPEKYVGTWYEIQRYPMFFEDETKCVTAEYTLNSNGTIDVYNSAILKTIDEYIDIKGKATPDPKNPANLTVEFERHSAKGQYWVLDTDYKNYSLVYSCFEGSYEPIRIEFSWILSRTPKLNQKMITKLIDQLVAVNSTVSNFEITDQTDCEY